ncbi:MAG: hypothetical protein NVS3B12_09240 [Acidimicrobiales bacterium]
MVDLLHPSGVKRSVLDFGPVRIDYDETVIEPRPWTLHQSEWAAEAARGLGDGPILELCSGAGQIGLAAAVLSDRDLVQVDASADACRLARVNAETAGRGGRVEVRNSTIDGAVSEAERFALVLADPPYVPTRQVGGFDDPRHAIDGGDDGLDLLVGCCVIAARHLLPGGILSIQLWGAHQAAQLGSRIPACLAGGELRSFAPDRAVWHLTRV